MTDSRHTLELLFRQHYTALYHFAMRLVGDGETCRDLVSEAFRQTYDRLPDIPAGQQQAFLYRLVRNKCIDHLRHQQARQRYADYYERAYAEETRTATAETPADEAEQRLQRVQHVMDTELTPRTRLVLERCYLHRKKYAEVAEELGISVSAVRKHIVTALRTLREKTRDAAENV